MKALTFCGSLSSVCMSKCFKRLLTPSSVVSLYPSFFSLTRMGSIGGFFAKHSGFVTEPC